MLRRGSTRGGAWSRTASSQTKKLKAGLEIAATFDEKGTCASSEPPTYYHAIYQLQQREENANYPNTSVSSEDDCNIRYYEPVRKELQDADHVARKRKEIVKQNNIIGIHEMYKHDLPLNSYQQSFLQHKNIHPQRKIYKDHPLDQKNPILG
ncbi:hypothetical protein scyTo_0002055 [Scyliorhinus torazame]|uniref:Uncharacterized protein n=1 Tax=Scyliorhinus torazame TaxID=75743 RepID=A0A401PHG4_SCYTO|nr:hypothetical protein [Scyliorhinus torazame]